MNDNLKSEVDEMTNMQILIEAIKIIVEKSETKEELLKELDRLLKKAPQ